MNFADFTEKLAAVAPAAPAAPAAPTNGAAAPQTAPCVTLPPRPKDSPFAGRGPLPDLNAAAQAGLRPDAGAEHWFLDLDPMRKTAAVALALGAIPLAPNDLPYETWRDLVWAVMDAGRHGLPNAEQMARDWSKTGARFTDAGFDNVVSSDKGNGVGLGTLFMRAEAAGADFSPFRTPVAKAANLLSSGATFDTSVVPRRRPLLGSILFRNYVTLFASRTKVGKSTFNILCTCALATGRSDLTGMWVTQPKGGGLRVLFINGEDTRDDLMGNFKATMLLHNITDAQMAGVTVFGKDDLGKTLKLTISGERKDILNTAAFDALEQMAAGYDVVFLDPLFAFSAGNINDNNLMAEVMLGLGRVAAQNAQAIMLTHHIAKGRSVAADGMDAATGASALLNHSRAAFGLRAMMSDEGMKFGVPEMEQRLYVTLDGLETNLGPPSGGGWWYRRVPVPLPGTADPPEYPRDDERVALQQWQPTKAADAVTDALRTLVLAAVDVGLAGTPLTTAARSKDRYAGAVLAPSVTAHPDGVKWAGGGAESFAMSVLRDVMAAGYVVEQDIAVKKQNGSNTRKGLVVQWGSVPSHLHPQPAPAPQGPFQAPPATTPAAAPPAPPTPPPSGATGAPAAAPGGTP